MSKPANLMQGTLDLLILKILDLEPRSGWAISQRLKQVSNDALQVSDGSLYPALHKLEQHGWITAEWRTTENNRRAEESALPRAEPARRPGAQPPHDTAMECRRAPPNGRHMMHMTALLEMADTLRPGHLLTTRNGWQEARCGTPDSTGNNGVPETVYRGGRQPPISR